jgi:hypothetical protein
MKTFNALFTYNLLLQAETEEEAYNIARELYFEPQSCRLFVQEAYEVEEEN